MSSSSAPSYYFNGIDFNFNFFNNPISTGSGLTTTQADARYLIKITPDTTSVLETFDGGLSTTTLTANILNCNTFSGIGSSGPINAWNNITSGIHYLFNAASSTTVNIGSSTTGGSVSLCPTVTSRNGSVNNTLWNNCNTNTSYFFNGLTTGNLNIATGSTFTGNLNIGNSTATGKINLNGPVWLSRPLVGPTTTQTLTSANIGYNFQTTTSSTSGPYTTGTISIFNQTNAVAVPIGVYLFTMNGSLNIDASTAGKVGSFTAGYALGTNASPFLNTQVPLFSGTAIDATGKSFVVPVSVTSMVSVSSNNSYITPSMTFTIATTFTTGMSSVINSYSVVRLV